MHGTWSGVAAAVALAAAGGAPSQTQDLPPPTPEASAEANRIIAAAKALDLFSDASVGETPEVLHKASGLRCTFEAGTSDNSIAVFPTLARGEDVGCTSVSRSGVLFTLYATRYPQSPSADEVMQGAVDEIGSSLEDVKPYRGDAVEMQQDAGAARQIPRALRARFTAVRQGRTLFTKVAVAQKDGWTYKMRATALETAAQAVDAYSEAKFAYVLVRLVEAHQR